MLNRNQLKEYREIRRLSQRDVVAYCNISQSLLAQIETGEKPITENAHEEICKGINDAYAAKCNGTFTKPKVPTRKKEEGIGARELAEIEAEKKGRRRKKKTDE